MLKNKLSIMVAFLLGITLFSIFKYIKAHYEKQVIMDKLSEKEAQILFLNTLKEYLSNQLTEKTQLVAKREEAQQELLKELNIRDEKLKKVEQLLDKAQMDIEALSQKIDALQFENFSLLQEKEILLKRLDKLSEEKGLLEAKWSSTVELKKAIVQLKRKLLLDKKQLAKMKDRGLEGNRGYIIKNGVSTWQSKIKIEVVPAD